MRFPVFLLLLLLPFTAPAQPTDTAALRHTILSRDSLLFQVGFNRCRIPVFESLLSDSLHFYHDRGGPAGKPKFLADIRHGLCKDPAAFQSRRELVPGTTRIFPLYRNGALYGAVQEGEHRFFETISGQPERFGSSARFTHLWLLEGADWKLAQALSFDHQPVEAAGPYPSSTADTAIGRQMQEHHVPVLGLGIIHGGTLTQTRVYGDFNKGRPAPYNTIFNVASLTKPVTALVALKLVSAGRWSLDEPLYKYFTDPDIAADPRHKALTTRLVLSHQTGFPNWRRSMPGRKLGFQFDPGAAYQYSGEGFEYLRKALERKFGKSLQELAQELIFAPLRLQDTRYVWNAGLDTARFVVGVDKDGKPYELVRNAAPNAADDLLTTVGDYGSFLSNILDRKGLTDSVYREMIRPQVATKAGKSFGLGFEIYDLGGDNYALSHGGSDEGVRSIVFLLPKTGEGLLIFTNSDTGAGLFEPLIRRFLGVAGQQIVDIEMR